MRAFTYFFFVHAINTVRSFAFLPSIFSFSCPCERSLVTLQFLNGEQPSRPSETPIPPFPENFLFFEAQEGGFQTPTAPPVSPSADVFLSLRQIKKNRWHFPFSRPSPVTPL